MTCICPACLTTHDKLVVHCPKCKQECLVSAKLYRVSLSQLEQSRRQADARMRAVRSSVSRAAQLAIDMWSRNPGAALRVLRELVTQKNFQEASEAGGCQVAIGGTTSNDSCSSQRSAHVATDNES
jgi:hypothetical protein